MYSVIKDFCTKDINLTPLYFDESEIDKNESALDPKNKSGKSKDKYNLRIEDIQDYDNSQVFFNEKNSKFLTVKKK